MNRYLKQEIRKAFEAPAPDSQEKARFLRTLPSPRMSMGQFILIQITYLRKRVLVCSVLFLLPGLMSVRHMAPDTLWALSALIPFLGLLAVTESTRSTMYGMQEFEMSTRFSMKSVVLARMSILGLLDLFVLCCLMLLCHMGSSNISLIQTGICLFVPYLLTVNISLYLARCFHGREAFYGCTCAAVLVSGGSWGIRMAADFIYRFSAVHWWLLLSVLLIGGMVKEASRTIRQTEELAWN